MKLYGDRERRGTKTFLNFSTIMRKMGSSVSEKRILFNENLSENVTHYRWTTI
jgi:hypothetical protein